MVRALTRGVSKVMLSVCCIVVGMLRLVLRLYFTSQKQNDDTTMMMMEFSAWLRKVLDITIYIQDGYHGTSFLFKG